MLTRDQLALARDMLEKGHKVKDVAVALGVGRTHLYYYLRNEEGILHPRTRQQIRENKRIESATRSKKWHDKINADPLVKQFYKRLSGKKSNALARGVHFDICVDDIEWPTHCPVLGVVLEYRAKKRTENSASFDRIDPSKGYVKGNVVVMSWRANRIKNDGTAEEHKRIYEWLVNNVANPIAN